MSNSDRKAVCALVTLFYIADKYSGIEAKEYKYFVDRAIKAYVTKNPVTDKEMDLMRSRLYSIDDKISELEFQSSITLTLAIGIMISEHFLSFVAHPVKRHAWVELHTWCNSNQLIKHSLRAQIFDALDEGDIVTSIITN